MVRPTVVSLAELPVPLPAVSQVALQAKAGHLEELAVGLMEASRAVPELLSEVPQESAAARPLARTVVQELVATFQASLVVCSVPLAKEALDSAHPVASALV